MTNIKKLLDIFSEIDADEILHHNGDKKKLGDAWEVILLKQEGLLRPFTQDDAFDAAFDSQGDFLGDNWLLCVENMRENRLKEAKECFPDFDVEIMTDLIWDYQLCSLDDAQWQFAGIVEAQTRG